MSLWTLSSNNVGISTAMSTHSIYHNLIIKATPSQVFEAVSAPKHLDNWWTLKSSGEPEVKAVYNLNFTDRYDWYCEVSQCELNKSFHLKMTKSDADWNPTTFGFDLEEREGEQTYLRFFHKDWPKENDHYKFSSFCWAMLLKGLKEYLEKGIIVPFDERN